MTHLEKIMKPIIMPYWWQDFLTALPRIICGFLLAFSFGADKFGLPWSPADKNLWLFEVAFWFPNDIAAYGGIFKMFPVLFAWMDAFSEAVGGLFLIFGFQTRIASFLVMSTMLAAIFMQQINEGIWNCLPAMGFLWVSLFGLIIGSGRFGLDCLLIKKSL